MENVVIFGATSAIAAEVAVRFAERGARLHLVARNAKKLAAVAASCHKTQVSTRQADFTELNALAAVVADAIATLGHIDVALIAHGDLGDQLASERSFQDAELALRTNLLSVIALLIPLANQLESQRSGQIGVITSVAGERGRPRNYTYGTAKGALNIYLQGLRSRLYSSGVGITTLKLGPVDTPMTVHHAKNALFAKPGSVARSIVHALDRRLTETYVPSFWAAIMPAVRATPEAVFQRLSFLSGR